MCKSRQLKEIVHNACLNLPEKFSWFPGHMYKAQAQIDQRIQDIDLFLEVRDSRIPICSKNFEIENLLYKRNKIKQRLIIFNKFDICNKSRTGEIIENYQKIGIDSIQVSAKKRVNLEQIVRFCQKKYPSKFNGSVGSWMMIAGMPNVGKSTIINQVRSQVMKDTKSAKAKTKVTKQTASVCTTKSVTGFRVNKDPLVFLIDSPGIMVPRFIDDETALKLSLMGCVRDKFIPYEHILEYMLWVLNKNQQQGKYMRFYALKGTQPPNSEQFFMQIREKYQIFNYQAAFDLIIQHFRAGDLGKVTLDSIEQNPIDDFFMARE